MSQTSLQQHYSHKGHGAGSSFPDLSAAPQVGAREDWRKRMPGAFQGHRPQGCSGPGGSSDQPALGGIGVRADTKWPPGPSQDLAGEHGGGVCQRVLGGAIEKEQSFLFLSAIKSIRELGMQRWGSRTLLPGPLRLRPGRHYNSGQWVGGWVWVRVGWAGPLLLVQLSHLF